MIVPFEEQLVVKVYRCPICVHLFAVFNNLPNAHVACLHHEAGMCCHRGEKPVRARDVAAAIEALHQDIEVPSSVLRALNPRRTR